MGEKKKQTNKQTMFRFKLFLLTNQSLSNARSFYGKKIQKIGREICI